MRIILFIALLISFRCEAATIAAATCDDVDVQAAIDSASLGDTVVIPDGNCTWDSQVVVDRKNLFMRGSGATRITITYAVNDYVLLCKALTNQFFSISNLVFVGGTVEYSAIGIRPVTSGGSTINTWDTPVWMRISHVTFTNLTKRGITTEGAIFGLIDHCGFDDSGSGQPTGVSPSATGASDIVSSNAWRRSWAWGTTNTLVIEDCWFDWAGSANGMIDSYGGQTWVFRNNTCTNGNIGNHGTDSGGSMRGTMAQEVYRNNIHHTTAVSAFQFRGGSVQIWSNNVTLAGGVSTANGAVIFNQYRNTGTNVYTDTAPIGCCAPYGPATGTNVVDGQENSTGYPGLDQLGRVGPTTFGATNSTQVLDPCYIWGNTYNGTNYNGALIGNDNANTGIYSHISRPSVFVQKDRDWYEDVERPSYTPLQYPHPFAASEAVAGTRGPRIRGIRLGR